jgi:DHA1 family tetracycline resistance protein-like MFS transporter
MPVLLLIAFVDLVGFGIVIPLLPFYAEHFGASPAGVTLLMAVYSLAQLLTAPALGALSDRYGRKRVIVLSLAGAAVGYVALGLAGSLAMLFAARALSGAMAGNIAAVQAAIADITAPEDRARGMGLFGAAFGLGFIVGPFLGGILAGVGAGETPNFALPPLAAAGLSTLALALAALLLPGAPPAPVPGRRGPHGALEPWLAPITAVAERAPLRALVLVFFLVVFAFAGLESTFALWAERALTWGPREVGFLFAGVGVVAVVIQGGAIGPLTRRLGEERLLLLGIGALAFGFLVLPASRTVAEAALAMAVIAAGFALANPTLHSLVSRRAPSGRTGASLGVAQAAGSLARILGPAAAGLLFTAGGRAAPYLASALILVLVGAGLWWRQRRGRAADLA